MGIKVRCSMAREWVKSHPNLTKKERNKGLKKFMKTHCIEDRSCFLCPMLEIK